MAHGAPGPYSEAELASYSEAELANYLQLTAACSCG